MGSNIFAAVIAPETTFLVLWMTLGSFVISWKRSPACREMMYS